MSSGILEEAVEKHVVKQVIGSIDVDAMVKRLAPKVEKVIEKNILDYINEDGGDMFYDIISEAINDKAYAAMRNSLSSVIIAAFKERK